MCQTLAVSWALSTWTGEKILLTHVFYNLATLGRAGELVPMVLISSGVGGAGIRYDISLLSDPRRNQRKRMRTERECQALDRH